MNHLFDEITARNPAPDAPFLIAEDGRTIRYGDLFGHSARFAQAMIVLGVSAGDRVAVQVEKCPEAVMLYLACLRAGAVLLPLNPAYTLAEMHYFVGDARPALIVCAPARAPEIAAAFPAIPVATLGRNGEGSLPEAARSAPAAFADAARGPDDLAAILYTSGTTGRAKGAMLTHENLASNARVLTDLWHFGPDDVLIHALPIFHTHGLFVATNVVLFAGASMLFFERFDPAAIIAAMPRATSLMGVPTFYVRLLEQPGLSRETAAGIRVFISGSAPLQPETFEAFRERTGHSILERYGMTETNMNSSNPYEGLRVAGTVGPALPGTSLRITDAETGRGLEAGATGVIEVKGPNVFAGYWRMPDKTAAEFRSDGFFITGDLGRIDGAGYLHIVGRARDLVISGGFNIYPKEVEAEIDAIDGVLESAVIGLLHPDFGEGVTAVVVASPGAVIDGDRIIAALETRLARYKQPKRVIVLAELPRNAMGKVQKAALREQFAGLYSGRGIGPKTTI